jgi:hypothetical protein
LERILNRNEFLPERISIKWNKVQNETNIKFEQILCQNEFLLERISKWNEFRFNELLEQILDQNKFIS